MPHRPRERQRAGRGWGVGAQPPRCGGITTITAQAERVATLT